MTPDEADKVVGLARSIVWRYPSSSGRPIPDTMSGDELVRNRGTFAEAASFLRSNGRVQEAMEIAAAFWRSWLLPPRDIPSGRALLARLLDGGPNPPSRFLSLALYGDSLFAFWQGSHEEAGRRCESALDVARRVKDPEASALALLGLARAEFERGNFSGARDLASQSWNLAGEVSEALSQAPLHVLGQATRMSSAYDEASAILKRSLDLNRKLGDEGMVSVELNNLGHVEAHRGNWEAAAHCFEEFSRRVSAEEPYDAALIALHKALLSYGHNDRSRSGDQFRNLEGLIKRSRLFLASDDLFEVEWLRTELGFK